MIEPLLTLGQSTLFFPASMFRKVCDLLIVEADLRAQRFAAGNGNPQLNPVEAEILASLQHADQQRQAGTLPADPWHSFFLSFVGSVGLGLPGNLDGPGCLLKMFRQATTEVECFRFFAITTLCLSNEHLVNLVADWWHPDAAQHDALEQEFIHGLNRYADLLTPLENPKRLPELYPYDLHAERPPAFRFLIRRLKDRDPIQPLEWWIKPEADSLSIPRRSWRYGLGARLRRANTGYAFPREWQPAWTIRQVLWVGAGLLTIAAAAAAAGSFTAPIHP